MSQSDLGSLENLVHSAYAFYFMKTIHYVPWWASIHYVPWWALILRFPYLYGVLNSTMAIVPGPLGQPSISLVK